MKKNLLVIFSLLSVFVPQVKSVFAQTATTTKLIRSPSVIGIISFIVGFIIVIGIVAIPIFIFFAILQWSFAILWRRSDKQKIWRSRTIKGIISLIIFIGGAIIINFVFTSLGFQLFGPAFYIGPLRENIPARNIVTRQCEEFNSESGMPFWYLEDSSCSSN